MLNRFKDVVSKSGAKGKEADNRPPPPPKPEKYCYSRPHFLGLNYDESLASRDFGLRPLMTPREPAKLPLQAGYAECINGGKSDFNEDQATATDLHLVHHLRTDMSLSCFDISLSHSFPRRYRRTTSPGPSSSDLNSSTSKIPSLHSPTKKPLVKQLSDIPRSAPRPRTTVKEALDDMVIYSIKDIKKDQTLSRSDESLACTSPKEVEMTDFVSSTSVAAKNEPNLTSYRKLEDSNQIPQKIENQQNHIISQQPAEGMQATYYGVFDGHASHTVSLIVSKLLHMIVKEKLELCMGVIKRINLLNKEESPDMTIEQLVIGALEEAFISMDEQLDRERTTYHIKGGCTALVALLFNGKLYVANAGDSRAVLCRGEKTEQMSHDFSAESEKQRLSYLGFCQPELLHGEFTCYEFLHRVNKPDLGKHVICRRPGRDGWILKIATEEDLKFPLVVGNGKRARVMGTIGVTRCLGDHDLYVYDSDIWIKPFLSPKPEVRVLDLTKEQWSDEDVLILGSDGLWDVVSNDKAAEIVRNTLKQPYEQGNEKYTIAAQELVQEARGTFTGKGWRKKNEEMASFDDITVFVIPLKHYIDKYNQNVSEPKSPS